MNEEIKKRITQFMDDYELACSHKDCDKSCSKKWYEQQDRKDIMDELYGYYLQGAKDMRESVSLNEVRNLMTDNDWQVGYWGGYNDAIDEVSRQAQQFIDSLEKGTTNE